MAIGLWPAISVFRAGGLQGLRSTSTSSPGARPRVRFALVTMQIALTLALLGGSALLLRSLWNVVNVPLGFDAERVITLTAGLSATRYPTAAHRAAFFEELLARARATPGAVSAALSDAPAPPGLHGADGRTLASKAGQPIPNARHPRIGIREVTPQYFETFRIPLVKGRTFQETDWNGEPAVVLNESAERMLFAGEQALGRRIRPRVSPVMRRPRCDRAWYTVVGVTSGHPKRSRHHGRARPRDLRLAARRGSWGHDWPSVASHDGKSCRCGRLPPADRRRPRSEAARDHRDRRSTGREAHRPAALHRVAADGIRRARAAAGGRRTV